MKELELMAHSDNLTTLINFEDYTQRRRVSKLNQTYQFCYWRHDHHKSLGLYSPEVIVVPGLPEDFMLKVWNNPFYVKSVLL